MSVWSLHVALPGISLVRRGNHNPLRLRQTLNVIALKLNAPPTAGRASNSESILKLSSSSSSSSFSKSISISCFPPPEAGLAPLLPLCPPTFF